VGADVLRLDSIHPIVSGNKWFKLKYHLQAAQQRNSEGIITFGGAYSNHLVASAWAAKEAGLPAIGIIRGEEPAHYSPTLEDMVTYGMELQFVNRRSFADEAQMIENFKNAYPAHFIIPLGGQSDLGVQGAAEILQLAPLNEYSHIACATGTGTMMAGLLQAALPHQQVIGISSLKTENAGNNSITHFIEKYGSTKQWRLFSNYHFGGYAKHIPALLQFMNRFYHEHGIPTDFVYTAKLFFAIEDLVAKNYFPKGSKLLIIHSGGLQGNRSLPPGTLTFL
jgi:1-aminocyclopropane-1-carboxylate deaminase